MTESHDISLPDGIDGQKWIEKWDQMQEYYIAHRKERFELMIQMVRAIQKKPNRILDLGCGTGSLAVAMLEAFEEVRIYGIDFDPTLLALAQARLMKFKPRAKLFLTDMRQNNWQQDIERPVDAVVSATALHWLKADELVKLYIQLAQILRPGGIFLNADHVASENAHIQQVWEANRNSKREACRSDNANDWETFWSGYMAEIGKETLQIHQRVLHGWGGGVEEGMPMAWHFDKLRQAGFSVVDCFWRGNCDAVYGGIFSG